MQGREPLNSAATAGQIASTAARQIKGLYMKSTYYLVVVLMFTTFIPMHPACEKERIALRASGGSGALKAEALEHCAQNHCNWKLHRSARMAACGLHIKETKKQRCFEDYRREFEKCMQDTRTGS